MMSAESPRDESGQELEATNESEPGPPARTPSREVEILGESPSDLTPTEPLGWIDKFKLANLQSKKELEAVAVVLTARVDLMRHQADAAARESKAYWDARSAEVVSAMKSFVQAKLRGIENERMASRLDALKGAYELFAEKVREVESGPLPEEMREELVKKMRENLEATIERLESDAIAEKYDLKD
jgi:hypothetical protein